ncbi:MAG: outer membrane beta-barrel protein [Hyphomicrobiaceae bacterium]
MRRILFTISAIAAFATAAAAQSTPPIWQGLYLGVHGGKSQFDVTLIDVASGETVDASTTKSAAGAFGGYNWQSGPWVLGAEADWTRTFGDSGDVDLFTLRARAGYAFNKVMVFGTAGFGMESMTMTYSTPGQSSDVDRTHSGLVVGGGIEAMLMPHLAIRAEALYFQGSKERFDAPIAGGTPADVEFNQTIYRAGLSYHFN